MAGVVTSNMSSPVIVIPVFDALKYLAACLESIDRSVPPETAVLLIDDASTDPGVQPLLQSWVEKAPAYRQVVTHKQNKGFVTAANHGMRLADNDVVLLNTDTEVHGDWLQRLTSCLQSDASIATATPWSNNGEIVSIPDFCVAQAPPSDAETVAAVIESCGTPCYPELPTAVGFCMAISLNAIKQIGLFDEQTFGRGYGEENDFCQTAAQAGLRNVLCDDAYVVHHGGASFGPLGLKPDERSMQRLLAKHPQYQRDVEAFIREDPLAPRRQEILACLERSGVRMR